MLSQVNIGSNRAMYRWHVDKCSQNIGITK